MPQPNIRMSYPQILAIIGFVTAYKNVHQRYNDPENYCGMAEEAKLEEAEKTCSVLGVTAADLREVVQVSVWGISE